MTNSIHTPRGEVTLRPATTDDAPALLELRLESLTLQPEAFAADVAMTIANGVKSWVELIEGYMRQESGSMSLALAGDELVGMAGIVRGHWPKTMHSGTIWGVYVKPTWRGLQVGTGLVNQCVSWAVEHNLTVVTLGVITGNVSAIRCYTRCGFTQYGIQPRATNVDGVYYDDLLMVKLL